LSQDKFVRWRRPRARTCTVFGTPRTSAASVADAGRDGSAQDWVGRRLEITYDIEGEHVPCLGWITGQADDAHVVVVFDSCWSVEQLKLPRAWRGAKPDQLLENPTQNWRLLPGSASYAVPAPRKQGTYMEESERKLMRWGLQVTNKSNHWRWIACSLGRFSAQSKDKVQAVQHRYDININLRTSEKPERLPTGIKKGMVLEALRTIGGQATYKDICVQLKASYPGLCDERRITPGRKYIKVYESAVIDRLKKSQKLFAMEKEKGTRMALWSLSEAVQSAIRAGNVEQLLSRPVGQRKREAMKRVKHRLNKVKAFGALAGR